MGLLTPVGPADSAGPGPSRGRRYRFRVLVATLAMPLTTLALLGAGTQAEAGAGEKPTPLNRCVHTDNGLPVVTGVTFTPAVIDTTTSAQRVTVELRITDTGGPGKPSGVTWARVSLGNPEARGWISSLYLKHAGGDRWRTTFTMPRHSAPGTWRLTNLLVLDRAGNEFAGSSEGFSAPLDQPLQVTSVPDTTPPVMTSLKISKRTVNTTNKARRVRISVAADDAGSGVDSVSVNFKYPDDRTDVELRRKGDVFTKKMRIPMWVGTSRWRATQVIVRDAVGNKKFYRKDALAALGRTHFKVTSRKDRAAPRLGAVTMSPKKVNTRTKAQTVRFSVRLKDAKSGVRRAQLDLAGKTTTLNRTKGIPRNGIWTGKIRFTPCMKLWDRALVGVSAYDRAGFDGNELHELGRRVSVKSPDRTLKSPRVVNFRLVPAAGPITLKFDEPVSGINNRSAEVRPDTTTAPWYGDTLVGTWRCSTATGRVTSCTTGKVRTASWTPETPLDTAAGYQVELNPEGNLDIRDRAGNAYRRASFEITVAS